MIYKTPQKHNSAIKTTLTNGIRKLLARRKYSSVKPLVLKEALEYHQKINDIEIKRMFCEELAKMQKVLPVITMDKGSMLKVKKVLSKHGFALMHMSDDMYLSTTLMHKAGFSMTTKIKLGVADAKRTNIINMLNLSVNMDETPDNKETEAEEEETQIENISDPVVEVISYIEAIKYAVENGESNNFKFGEETLESAYKKMLQIKADGSDVWDECIEEYEYAFYESVFIDAIKKALKDGHGVKHKFGHYEQTLESYYMTILIEKAKGSKEYDVCIEAYQKAFFGIIFMNGTKFAVENEKGTNYKFNPPSTMSLEKGYKQLLATKKETGTNDLNEYIDYYEDVFYEEVFIYAVNESLKYGKGIKHKFTVNQITLEQAHNSMLIDKGHGAVKWDACIKAYDDAFNCKGSHDGAKVEDDEDKDSPVTTLPKTGTEDKKKALAKAKAEQEAQAAKDKEDARIKAEEEAIAKALAEDKKKAKAKAAKAAKAKAKQDAIDAEERATINALIDKVERLWKSGKYKYAEHDVYEPPETFEYRTARQGLISFYKEMLKEQAAGSDKWNPCIQKYQDTFTEHAFINLIKNGKGIGQKFGTKQNRIEDVYKGMLTVQANDEDEWDDCIETYSKTFFNTAFIYAIKRAKMTGMGIKYMWVKNKFTLEQMYKQMLEKQVKGDKKFDKYIQAYEHSFGYDKNLIK